MKNNYLTVIFWFNIFDKHTLFLDNLRLLFKEEFNNYTINNFSGNILTPVLNANNPETKTSFSMSQINFQYVSENVKNIGEIKEKMLELFETFKKNDIKILHTSIILNGEIDDSLTKVDFAKTMLNKNYDPDNLVDFTIRIGNKYEDLFYKIINVSNRTQLKIPQKRDDAGHVIPIPLVSWKNAILGKETLEINYEINDKYLFDNQKDYLTTEFYLNKMFFVLENDYHDDVDNLINSGKF